MQTKYGNTERDNAFTRHYLHKCYCTVKDCAVSRCLQFKKKTASAR